jgi:phosphopantothenoylcysteine decarboxylase/phosphopantothenate--cysteine ligase
MKILVTCGPGSEPIDQVRFISNFSTGELGMLLSAELQQHGFQVICLRSKLATYPIIDGVETIPFSTNDELASILQQLSVEENIAAVFHAAALCDYRVKKIDFLPNSTAATNCYVAPVLVFSRPSCTLPVCAPETPCTSSLSASFSKSLITTVNRDSLHLGKIPTSAGELSMTLEPSLKLIAKLRHWFPSSLLVGWKYEVVGTREEAVSKAKQQIERYQLDASVANGPALENGFEFITVTGAIQFLDSKSKLVHFLSKRVLNLKRNF